MKKNILVLIGSPRKNGNTELLSNEFIANALSAGNSVEKVIIQPLKINGCLGCDYCARNHGMCLQKDDMQNIYEKLERADVVVLATPLYFFGFSAQIKAVIDRFYALLSGNLAHKKSILIAAYGSQDTQEINGLVNQYRMIADALNWENSGEIVAKGVLNKGEIVNHPSMLEAQQLGKTI